MMSRSLEDSSRPTRVSYLDIISFVRECRRNRLLMQPLREDHRLLGDTLWL